MIEASFKALKEGLNSVLYGKPKVVEFTLIAALSGGHLLIEDLPGVGKTTLGRAMAQLLGGKFQRVQFTADLMPSDLTGVSVFNPKEAIFSFQPGPLFCHVLLADEINRASPKAQSSLLEAMGEAQVSIDRTTYPLPHPFWVIATQNPSYFEGTYPLPESQLDRFMLSISIGYPSLKAEREVLKMSGGHRAIEDLHPIFTPEEWAKQQALTLEVKVDDDLVDYLLGIVKQTRDHSQLRLGVSTRGALSWQRASQARALLCGRDYVTPDDLKMLAIPSLAHRVWPLRGGVGREEREEMIQEILSKTPIPR